MSKLLVRKCRVSLYNVINRDTGAITYGWKCPRCGIPSKRYSTKEKRNKAAKIHLAKEMWRY